MRFILIALLAVIIAGCAAQTPSTAEDLPPPEYAAPPAQPTRSAAPQAVAPAEEVLKTGVFTSEDGRRIAKGVAHLVRAPDGTLWLRFNEDFLIQAGPRLMVYITDGALPLRGINLGPLAEIHGGQEYRVPDALHENNIRRVYVFSKDYDLIAARADLR